MSEKDNSVPPSSFEIEREARIKRSLVIKACVRGIVRPLAEWLRSLILRSTQLARPLAAQRRHPRGRDGRNQKINPMQGKLS
jgi:hypothetical protein